MGNFELQREVVVTMVEPDEMLERSRTGLRSVQQTKICLLALS